MSFFLCFSLFRSSLFLLLRLCDVKNKMIALSCSSVAMCETNFTDGTCYKCFSTALHYQLNIHNCSLSSSVEQTNKNSLFKHFFFLVSRMSSKSIKQKKERQVLKYDRPEMVWPHMRSSAPSLFTLSPLKSCADNFLPHPLFGVSVSMCHLIATLRHPGCVRWLVQHFRVDWRR